MKRFGQIIGIKPEFKEKYIYLHQHPRKEVNDMIKKCNIQNYSIFCYGDTLFAYFEYTGDDYEEDMKKMAEDPETQKWWDLVKPMQNPLEDRKEWEWWVNMDEVYHLD